MRGAQRAAVVAAYVLVFWAALPAALWLAATRLDAAWLGAGTPCALLGIPSFTLGAALLAWGIAELWRGGGGLPVSALPPPRLARRGPYRVCRHPIYLGFHVALVGASAWAGSRGALLVLAPAFLPLWVLYALVEERGLRRRFGEDYRRYQREVGLFPRLPLYWITWAVFRFLWPMRVEGAERVPREGPLVFVANHACYLDPAFLVCVTRRRMRFLTTAEFFRKPVGRWASACATSIPLRRYARSPAAMRTVLRELAQGGCVGIFPTGERSVLGCLLPPLPGIGRILARLKVPVIPVGISGHYQVGPRWADRWRVRPVKLVVGPPVDFGPDEAAFDRRLSEAIERLVEPEPDRVRLEGFDRKRLARAVWRCPGCLAEAAAGWSAERLSCGACGASFDAAEVRVAQLAAKVWQAPEPAELRARAAGAREASRALVPEPLEPMGAGELVAGPEELRFGELRLPLSEVRTVTVERADTLQVATLDRMWQFRLEAGSAFRLQNALLKWKGPAPAPERAPRRAPG